MIQEHFIDLDELLLRCRSQDAKKYIQEAILCYKVGAFRASIVSTWVAIIYDFIDKLRELSATEDKNAQDKLEEFDKARRHHNPTGALNFERNILEWSSKDFEFISPIQKKDLERLVEDRNRCAHPSMMTENEIYQPSAEQARLHIRNAVTHFLQYPPTQGKFALDKLRIDVLSKLFPVDEKQAVTKLKDSALNRSKPALIKNFSQLMMKEFILLGNGKEENQKRIACALNALRNLKRFETEQFWQSELNTVISRVEESRFGLVVRFLSLVHDTWEYLNDGMKVSVTNYVKEIPSNETINIAFAVQIPALKPYAITQIPSLTKEQLALIIKEIPDPIYFDYAIAHYENAQTTVEIDFVSRELILPLTEFLNVEYATKILEAFHTNSIAFSSPQQKLVLTAIQNAPKIPTEAIGELYEKFKIDDMIDLSVSIDDDIPY